MKAGVARPGTFAADLQSARQRAKLSRGEVARRMGVGAPLVSRMESGRYRLREDSVRRYAAALGCDPRIVLKAKGSS
jgi:transcriptional regulator with XRE-family HTH domain